MVKPNSNLNVNFHLVVGTSLFVILNFADTSQIPIIVKSEFRTFQKNGFCLIKHKISSDLLVSFDRGDP